MRRIASRRDAFTLVELLVVIGIIAVLIGILLPVLSAAQERGRAIKCLSNLRQIGQTNAQYQGENEGSFPWGFIYENMDLSTGTSASNAARPGAFYSWMSLLGTYVVKGADPGNIGVNITGANPNTATFSDFSFPSYPPIGICAEAQNAVESHPLSYAALNTAFVHLKAEIDFGLPGYRLEKPAKASQARGDTIIVFDTAIPVSFGQLQLGWLTSADIDFDGRDQRFLIGSRFPQFRFEDSAGRYSSVPGLDAYTDGAPIFFPVGGVGGGPTKWLNIDPVGRAGSGGQAQNASWIGWQGNFRFRHGGKKNAINQSLMADTSVQTFSATFLLSGSPAGGYDAPDGVRHDIVRRKVKMKWPTGIEVNPNGRY